MSDPNKIITDIVAPLGTTTGGIAATTAPIELFQWVGLAASIIGIIWGAINILTWCSNVAIPWLKAKNPLLKK